MTTLTETTHRPESATLARIFNVTRLHLINRFPIMVLPLLILAFIFLVNYVIWWLLFDAVGVADRQDAIDGIQFSGASSFIFIYMLVVAVQAVNLTFPFALGFSVTRRDFYLGTCVAFVLLSAYYAAIMTVMAVLERVTNGWGLGGSMFDVVYFREENPVLQFVLFLLIFLFFFFIGAATASVYVRWRANGMYVFFAFLTLLVIGFVALTTFADNWPAVGAWFARNGAMGVALWSLVPTTLAAITGFYLMRRATPKN
ncbi:ABC transporter permease [Homoserinimonas sp. OAct 916]|uniref:ABC transporter permease n=1 Tax=Homoserinimonas sp. OAct 916 TaxID=2211450 RepID=UPI000DBE81CD|nr:ABC transporter permease [Homoserinimonas sp. OAct 916]